MNTLKKVLAWIGLAAMAVFVVSIIVFFAMGTLSQNMTVVYAALTVFLISGLGSLLIRYIQQRAEEKSKAE